MGRVLTRIVVVIGLLALAAAVTLGVRAYVNGRTEQREDFKADLAAVGFVNAKVTWEDEEDESELEAIVSVAGCSNIELERDGGEKSTNTIPGGRKIELYAVDGVVVKGREIPTDDYRGFMATPTDIKSYLIKGGETRFPCLNAAAA